MADSIEWEQLISQVSQAVLNFNGNKSVNVELSFDAYIIPAPKYVYGVILVVKADDIDGDNEIYNLMLTEHLVDKTASVLRAVEVFNNWKKSINKQIDS